MSGSALLSGCAIMGGDVPMRVTGAVPAVAAAGAHDRANCTLDLVMAKNGKVRFHRIVSRTFDESFSLEARRKFYYFVAECSDGWKSRSKEFELGGSGSFDKLIELGTMDREKP